MFEYTTVANVLSWLLVGPTTNLWCSMCFQVSEPAAVGGWSSSPIQPTRATGLWSECFILTSLNLHMKSVSYFQGAGWPGQWQQQPTPPPPHQQQSGYYGPRPPQGGFPQQQFPTPHQFGPTPQQPMTPAQAFAVHQQQLQAMQQKQVYKT